MDYKYIYRFEEINKDSLPMVGGKGANLGEMTQHKLDVPPGFCVSSDAYRYFVSENKIDNVVRMMMKDLDVEDADALRETSENIQDRMNNEPIPEDLQKDIIDAYREFSEKVGLKDPEVAVRSSATAEDLPDASFAGQQDTYLHISGEDELLKYVRSCWASLWTARAIYYREKQKYDHFDVALSVVVQKMVNSQIAGVMFTANPVTSNTDEIMINASWGLGEAVVSGTVSPDDYVYSISEKKVISRTIAEKNTMVVKIPGGQGTKVVNTADELGQEYVTKECLSEEQLMDLITYAKRIYEVYGSNQDVEWAFDKDTKKLYILQSRPITTLDNKAESKEEEVEAKELIALVKGLVASPGTGAGPVKLIKDITEISRVEDGDILVTGMTNPDMVPAMKKAAAVVTDDGGRTCHAAIVSRELGIPCIVGSKDGTKKLAEGQIVTVDATRGIVYEGKVMQEKKEEKQAAVGAGVSQADLSYLSPVTATKIYMNLGDSSIIDRYKDLPFDGIGLMRTEFIFNNVGAHPMYLVKTGQGQLLIDKMSESIGEVARAIFPRQLVVRLSDFRTNEFRGLKGGDEVEPVEANPMIGWRGVSRYISPAYEEGFRLECRAIKKVREENGLKNVYVMLPFVRTTDELKKVKEIMAEEGLVQNQDFKLWIMAEVPSVVFQAEEFAQMVDGFSIGSNDLTQLTMGADRDNGTLGNMGYLDERNPAVKRAISTLIKAAHKYGKTCSICGQGPSTYPEFAEFLVNEGIDSMSVNPDTVQYTRRLMAGVEKKIILNKLRSL